MKDPNLNLNLTKDFTGWESRSARTVPSSLKREDKSVMVEAVVTTEQPAIVADWENWELVREVLLMDGLIMPDTKQVPLLDTHSRFSTSDIKGSIRNLRVDGSDLVGDVYFWSKAEDEISQVEEGHLTDLSAGYKTFGKEFTVELKPGQEKEVSGRLFKNDFEDGLRLLIRTKWEIKEGSLVPIGADSAAKFRSESSNQLSNQSSIQASDPELQSKINEIYKEVNSIKSDLKIKLNKENTMNEGKTPEQIQIEERNRISRIEELASQPVAQKYKGGAAELAEKKREFISQGKSAEEFQLFVFNNYDETIPVKSQPATAIGMSDNEVDRFSISKAILAEANVRGGDVNAYDKLNAGFEREVLNAAKASALKVENISPKGIILPYEVIAKRMIQPAMGQRTLTVGSSAGGGYLKGTDHLGSEFVGLLRNKTIAGRLGVRILSGLKGNIDVPKQLTAGTFAWGAENWAVTDTDMTFGQITASPKEGKSSTTYGRKLLLQSDPSVDQIVNDDLLNIARIGVDYAVFHGAGTNEPTGLAITSGIGDVVGTSLDHDAILEFEEKIAIANADDASLKWATNPSVRKICKSRLKSSGVAGYLMDDNGNMNGYGSEISNQIASRHLFFGDWSKIWLCDWSMFDLLVNPYKDNTGNVTVVVFVYADVAVQIASAFVESDDVD